MRKLLAQKQKTRWALLRQRADECFSSESLCTPHRARRLATMMMMVPMGV
jgi:hypothetical protein